jgi:hypothetical protein
MQGDKVRDTAATVARPITTAFSPTLRGRHSASPRFLPKVHSMHFACDSRDVPVDAWIEHLLPRRQAESQPEVDHRVTPAGEIGRADEGSADMLAGFDQQERTAARLRRFLLPCCSSVVTRLRGGRNAQSGSRLAWPVDRPLSASVARPSYLPAEPILMRGVREVTTSSRSSQLAPSGWKACGPDGYRRPRPRSWAVATVAG